MKKQFVETVALPSGTTCEIHGAHISLKKGAVHVSKTLALPLHTNMKHEAEGIKITCTEGNKKSWAGVRAMVAHIENMLKGLDQAFTYELEICNVHFPMTVKVEGNSLAITNFLGEKQKRVAYIIPGVTVEVKGQKVIVSSSNVESAGQTAANIEHATHVTKRDRRVFQDGIFIVSKNGRAI